MDLEPSNAGGLQKLEKKRKLMLPWASTVISSGYTSLLTPRIHFRLLNSRTPSEKVDVVLSYSVGDNL